MAALLLSPSLLSLHRSSFPTTFLSPPRPPSSSPAPAPRRRRCGAVADRFAKEDRNVLYGEDERRREKVIEDYDWRTEWYPLYLAKDVPADAPLGLTVFDRQLVLYRDGSGELRCHEDRCPHRYTVCIHARTVFDLICLSSLDSL